MIGTKLGIQWGLCSGGDGGGDGCETTDACLITIAVAVIKHIALGRCNRASLMMSQNRACVPGPVSLPAALLEQGLNPNSTSVKPNICGKLGLV